MKEEKRECSGRVVCSVVGWSCTIVILPETQIDVDESRSPPTKFCQRLENVMKNDRDWLKLSDRHGGTLSDAMRFSVSALRLREENEKIILHVNEEEVFFSFFASVVYFFCSMSAHEGVSCDACGKSNFRSKRYKCLICYDYDLCATCYERGETSSHHTTEHPMQCETC